MEVVELEAGEYDHLVKKVMGSNYCIPKKAIINQCLVVIKGQGQAFQMGGAEDKRWD